MKDRKIRYYHDFSDDFETTKNQNYTLPDDYCFIKEGILNKIISFLIYRFAVGISFFYCKFILHMKIVNKADTSLIKNGCFVYSNHTQPFGDVFIPAFCLSPKRIYTIVSTANYGIPIIGKILPYLGALPIPDNFGGMKNLNRAIEKRLEQNHPIIIFPEAHVWEYFAGIRPFPSTSFSYPVMFNKPSYSITVTYQKSKFFKRPKMTVFLDGPFFPDGETKKEKTLNLHNTVISQMTKRSESNNISYIEYIKKEN